MHNENNSFLGKGWHFPPTFGTNNARLMMVSEEEDIKESLLILFNTLPGERIMNPDYGCDLHSQVFERMDEQTKARIIDIVTEAIDNFETRIILEDVDVRISANDESIIFIMVNYTVIQTNARTNIVYPFYLEEGTHVPQILQDISLLEN